MSRYSLQSMVTEKRAFLGLSLQKLADRAGVSKAHLWQLERGISVNPSVRTVEGLATALGIPFELLALGARNDLQKREPT